MTEEVKKMFIRRKQAETKKGELVFPDKNGNKMVQISKTYYRVVDELGLNKEVPIERGADQASNQRR